MSQWSGARPQAEITSYKLGEASCGVALFPYQHSSCFHHSLSPLACFGQQDYIARYSVFTAFSYLSTPSLNLAQRGFDGDVGVNVRPWLTLGGDFSYQSGHSS